MKYVKSQSRSALKDEHFPLILMLENANLELQLSAILSLSEKNSILLIHISIQQKQKLYKYTINYYYTLNFIYKSYVVTFFLSLYKRLHNILIFAS